MNKRILFTLLIGLGVASNLLSMQPDENARRRQLALDAALRRQQAEQPNAVRPQPVVAPAEEMDEATRMLIQLMIEEDAGNANVPAAHPEPVVAPAEEMDEATQALIQLMIEEDAGNADVPAIRPPQPMGMPATKAVAPAEEMDEATQALIQMMHEEDGN